MAAECCSKRTVGYPSTSWASCFIWHYISDFTARLVRDDAVTPRHVSLGIFYWSHKHFFMLIHWSVVVILVVSDD